MSKKLEKKTPELDSMEEAQKPNMEKNDVKEDITVNVNDVSAEEEILPRTYYHVASTSNDSELNIYV